jgi:hypothetical protein
MQSNVRLLEKDNEGLPVVLRLQLPWLDGRVQVQASSWGGFIHHVCRNMMFLHFAVTQQLCGAGKAL